MRVSAKEISQINTKKQAPTQRFSGVQTQCVHVSPRAALGCNKQRREPEPFNLETESSGLGSRRVVTAKVPRNSKTSQPTREAKIVPNREELTQAWPQQELALRLKSPGNTRGYINHCPDTGPYAQTNTLRHAMHTHRHTHTSASEVQLAFSQTASPQDQLTVGGQKWTWKAEKMSSMLGILSNIQKSWENFIVNIQITTTQILQLTFCYICFIIRLLIVINFLQT